MLAYRWRADLASRSGPAPVAEIRVASGEIVLIAAPGMEEGLLPGPGTGLVLRAETAGTIEVTLRSAFEGGSLVADLELKNIETPRPVAGAVPGAPRTELPRGACDFSVTAHVSLRGDLTAARGDWICGPGAPGRIEGLEIKALSGDLPVEVQVASGGRLSGWTPWLAAGTYAGSRGKASPLIGLRLRLTAEAPAHLALKADATFLGAPTLTRVGREIELSGASLLDPLVGLRLDIVEAGAADLPAPAVPVLVTAPPSRLRVFRRAPESAVAA
ncbi:MULTISPECIES: hypothetical protein [unclassified Aureimonas]|uniref:hypothetical protein n=1 Tax=unclassified Aureimonas TaxID=2615206 RepID=UPI0006FB2E09|nr:MULTISPECIES: hypothetical protein [unclassified Aureimonas]KQT61269.1 hypothetical protein ASG54_24340 [Aureimonas sp. Leaf460]KQT68718.1 hypothetical protein ASG62_19100 [Aureimonas sp. Leaf427]